MRRCVLLIAAQEGVENCARLIEESIGTRVEVARDRNAGLQALRRTECSVVVIEEGLLECDPVWADQVWESAGSAIPLQISFAISGCGRVLREVKAALARQQNERTIARRFVASEIENDLNSTVTGLLLEGELALHEPTISPTLKPKLRNMVEMAGNIRARLRGVQNLDAVREVPRA